MRNERQHRVGAAGAEPVRGLRIAQGAAPDITRPDPTQRVAAYRRLIARAAFTVRRHAAWAVKPVDETRRRSA